MKIWDWEAFFFRLNLASIALVFILLVPTTRILASWFPDKEDVLWLFPVGVLTICSMLWLLMKFSLPFLIRQGVFEDRRKGDRYPEPPMRRMLRMVLPVLTMVIQMGLIIFMLMCLIEVMRSGTLLSLFQNLG